MTRSLAARWLGFVALAGVAGWIVASRLTLSYDLAYFLPQPVTEAQRVLIDRVGQGPGSRILYVTLPGATTAQRDDLAERLAALAEVRAVLPRDAAADAGDIPPPLREHRYRLADIDTSVAGLRRALEARLEDLSLVDDPTFIELVAADPHLATLQVLEGLAFDGGEQQFVLDDGTPYLLLETRPAAFDLAAQQRLVERVEGTVESAGHQTELYGAGAYGVRLQESVRRESTFFSLAAAGALALLLWAAYRSLRAAWLASLPLIAGGLTGLATLALAFPQVHGITLAFGFTLMGVTVDYGLHVLSHLRAGGRRGLGTVWPTLALGVASTALAFLAFTLSGSRGLVQLGVFSVAGILVAAFFAWFLLPHVAARPATAPATDDERRAFTMRLRYWPMLACLVAGAGLLVTDRSIWNDDLSSLTPVPEATLEVDRRLRRQSGAPDIRHLVVSRGSTERQVLDAVSALEGELAEAREEGLLGGFRAVTALVPDRETQERRRRSLDPEGLPQRLEEAVTGLPFRASALAPFVAAVGRAAADDAPVTTETYADSALAELVEGMLYRDGDEWVALTFLSALHDPAALAARLDNVPDAELVDLQAASQSLLATYRTRLLQILAGALLIVAAVLWLGVRDARRWGWVMGTLIGSVVLTTALVGRLIGSLSLFDLVAVTLVGGLGLDYALFFSRPQAARSDYRNTLHAVTVCFASTATVFGLLSASGIPVLHGIGVTVTTGVVVSYLLALLGRTRCERGQANPGTVSRAGSGAPASTRGSREPMLRASTSS